MWRALELLSAAERWRQERLDGWMDRQRWAAMVRQRDTSLSRRANYTAWVRAGSLLQTASLLAPASSNQHGFSQELHNSWEQVTKKQCCVDNYCPGIFGCRIQMFFQDSAPPMFYLNVPFESQGSPTKPFQLWDTFQLSHKIFARALRNFFDKEMGESWRAQR